MTQDPSQNLPLASSTPSGASQPTVGRNEPCPCGSGKKYKRCHGVDAAPKLSAPKSDPSAGAANPFAALAAQSGKEGAAGFSPEQNQMMLQVAQLMQRLPKGQLQRLQSIMQRAMAGKDVRREAAEFEASLPPAFHDLLKDFQMPGGLPGMAGMGGVEPSAIEAESSPASTMTEDEARALVAKAAAQGKISTDQAQKLLESTPGAESSSASAPAGGPSEKKSSGFAKLFKKFK